MLLEVIIIIVLCLQFLTNVILLINRELKLRQFEDELNSLSTLVNSILIQKENQNQEIRLIHNEITNLKDKINRK